MAEVVAPGQDTHLPQPQLHHGKKRAADSSLESEQRLSKRFDLLNIVDNNGTRLYIPVAGSSDAAATTTPQNKTLKAPVKQLPAHPPTHKKRRDRSSPPYASALPDADSDSLMDVEDTPHRIYIRDLSAELSDLESDEETPVFLCDIEKHLANMSKHVLLGGPRHGLPMDAPEPTPDNQVVLYNVPSSLSVPEAQDSVRRAIVEARARVRDRQAVALGEPERVVADLGVGDDDAMDID